MRRSPVNVQSLSSAPVATPSSSNGSVRPLSTLSNIATPSTRRSARFDDDGLSLSNSSITQVEKDADDPTTPVGRSTHDANEYTTPRTLTRLLGADLVTSPDGGRGMEHAHRNGNESLIRRSLLNETASLPDHLYTRGLLGGRHSDITIIAFGHRYALHRLILDRAPFFCNALSDPWVESTVREVPLHPVEIDANITQTSFELALKRLYGCGSSEEEDTESVGLFAVGCWLEMQDLVESSIDSILRQMKTETLGALVRLVTAQYYGRAGERILASAKAMLCRDGWEMPLRYWDGLPGDIIREIVGGDGFFVPGEWDRWVLAKRLLDRRLKQRAIEAGLMDPTTKEKVKAPDSLGFMAVRFDGVYRQNSVVAGRGTPDSHHAWLALYTHPDIEPLLVLLDEGIHYIHLDFEQLQYIRQAKDSLGLPVMPERVITNALWMAMELRQKVMNARDLDMELGLSMPSEEQAEYTPRSSQAESDTSSSKGKQKQIDTVTDSTDESDEMESGSWDANGRPRKFWIPSTDCNIVMGGNAEPVVTTSQAFQRHASRLSATIQPEDAQWASDFASSPSNNADTLLSRTPPSSQRPGSSADTANQHPQSVAYTHFPPFRFAAEFPNPRLLKEKKRVYSRTVFYAGSLWNIYIQKVRSNKNPQLGVYLHRAKEREAEEVISSNGSAGAGLTPGSTGSVDERIGLLEREMLLRSERRERRQSRREVPARDSSRTHLTQAIDPADAGADSSGSAGDVDTGSRLSGSALSSRRQMQQERDHRMAEDRGSLGGGEGLLLSTFPFPPDSDEDDEEEDLFPPSYIAPSSRESYISYGNSSHHRTPTSSSASASTLLHKAHHSQQQRPQLTRTPTMPSYVDARPTIKTYFKIYSPSKGGRLLSVYESAPDRFNFSQSWGWKSSTLMLDEGLMDDGGIGGSGLGMGGSDGPRGEGRLRFMVVIGNL
ncbi:hypothetical protein K402DRAFT_342235 [Aulographum hederae CBS 113979]|uniref:BTB domain-containing protein n=1 Tax=Aulographum hederae CBS 113979 TaxID=1176131 RepID=A0A6G1GKS2_9PEZI|nr:hypothetical protein K402DRAFT_342235 [Aulographum hederae CBS 113979]